MEMAIIKEFKQESYVEMEKSQLMSILKGQDGVSKALFMAMDINIAAGYEIITAYEMTVLKQHYKQLKIRDLKKEMTKGYMKMLSEAN